MNGPIPDGMVVMHRCDNRPCFRYDHLRLGTQGDNVRDAAQKGRISTRPGTRSLQAKLTDDQVREIRRLHEAGMSNREVAALFGISHTTAQKVYRREDWRHIE